MTASHFTMFISKNISKNNINWILKFCMKVNYKISNKPTKFYFLNTTRFWIRAVKFLGAASSYWDKIKTDLIVDRSAILFIAPPPLINTSYWAKIKTDLIVDRSAILFIAPPPLINTSYWAKIKTDLIVDRSAIFFIAPPPLIKHLTTLI